MTKEEIEEIIRNNIKTNGRGEITARVMAGVLESFVSYTDSQADAFEALCRALAASFSALVTEMEGRFETKADALEAAFEAFTTDLLENHFEPWAETLASTLTQLMRETKAAALDAKTAALDAKTAADGASTASGQAKAAADAAAADASDAKDASILAKVAAETASDGAVAAAQKAEYAKTSADAAAENAAAAKVAAEGAETAAENAEDAIIDTADGIAEALEIIKNGNTDAPGNANSDVVFFDYDGTVVKAYTKEEFLRLESMPENPSHDGLTAEGWNWTLSDAQDYVSKYGLLSIGQLYKPTDGSLHLFITLSTALTFSFYSVAGTVDWGDGSAPETISSGGSHTYASAVDYEIKISGVSGSIRDRSFENCVQITEVWVPEDVTSIGRFAFQYSGIKKVTLHSAITQIGASAFYSSAIKCAIFPPSISVLDGLRSGAILFPSVNKLATSIGANGFDSCLAMERIAIPEGLTSIGNYAFQSVSGAAVVCPAVVPPTLGTSVFNGNKTTKIYVPDESVAAYKAATNWNAYASMIYPISQM